jgi:hypothetical protein
VPRIGDGGHAARTIGDPGTTRRDDHATMNRIRHTYAAHPTAATVAVVLGALLLTALAAVLLLSLLGTRAGLADASPSVAAPESIAPTPSEAPLESPSTPASSPSEEPVGEVVYGDPFAVETTAELALLEAPGGSDIGRVPAGEIAIIAEGPLERDGADWLLLSHGEIQGWVAADDPSLVIHRSVASNQPAQILGVDAGSAGFAAWGIESRVTDGPPRPLTAVSSDGRTWVVGEPPDGEIGELLNATVAGGPNGWLMLRGNPEGLGLGGAWRSEDGVTWEPVELSRTDGGEITNLVPYDLLGHANGYALVARDDTSGTSRYRVLTSADGLAWEEREMPEGSGDVKLEHLGDGFMASTVFGEGELAVRFSPDGEAWLDPTGNTLAGPIGYTTMLVEADGVIVAASSGIEDGRLRVWTSPAPTADRVATAWTEQPGAADGLDEAVVTKLLHVEGAALALGRRIDDGSHQAWRSTDGVTWTELDPTALTDTNASTWYAAGADSGAVVVGYATTDAGPNPMLLASPDGGTWEMDGGSVLGLVDSSLPGACPERPTNMVDWMAIPGVVGAECFGDAPITFTAWHTQAGGCGGFSPGFYDPTWLASPFAGTFVLLPYEAPTGGCGGPAQDPEAGPAPELLQWIELTGHWADPASAECRYRPDPAAPSDPFRPDLVFHCRTVFVVSEAVPGSALAP